MLGAFTRALCVRLIDMRELVTDHSLVSFTSSSSMGDSLPAKCCSMRDVRSQGAKGMSLWAGSASAAVMLLCSTSPHACTCSTSSHAAHAAHAHAAQIFRIIFTKKSYFGVSCKGRNAARLFLKFIIYLSSLVSQSVCPSLWNARRARRRARRACPEGVLRRGYCGTHAAHGQHAHMHMQHTHAPHMHTCSHAAHMHPYTKQ